MPPPLSKEESKKALIRTHDMAFLIAPNASEELQERAKCIGLQFAHVRRMRELSSVEVALHMQTDKERIWCIEGAIPGRGIIFNDYVGYADYLGISLSTLYEASQSSQNRSQILKEEWVERVNAAIQQLESRALPVSQQAVAEILGASRKYLRTLPSVKAILDQYEGDPEHSQSQRFQEEQKKIFEQAQAAIVSLESQHLRVTIQAMSRVTGLTGYKLRTYLRGTPLLRKIIGEDDYYNDGTRMDYRREKDLIGPVQSTIEELQSQGEPITRKTIAEKMGMSHSTLYPYPGIKELVKEYTKPASSGYSENELVEQVQAAINTLISQGKAIGYQSVGQMIGVPEAVLRRSVQVKKVLDETIEQVSQDLYKAEVLALVQTAIEQLEAQGKIIEYRSVCKMVGISKWVLQRQTQVRALLYEARRKQKSEEAKRKQKSEREIRKKVLSAIKTLTLSGTPIGYQTVSETTQLPQNVLRRYRSVKKLIENQQRETEVLAKVQEAMKALETLGEPITLSSIKEHAHLTNIMLKRYPLVREILAPFIQTETRDDEKELVSRVQTAIQMLNNQNRPVTFSNLREMIGASFRDLRRYPSVKTLVKNVREDRLHQQHQRREEELLIRVKLAIQELIARGVPVTQTAISQEVQLRPQALKQYPQVREVLVPIAERNR